MGAVYSVQVEDEGEAKARLAEMCAALGLRPIGGGRAIRSPSTGKWLVRAEPDQRGQRQDGLTCTATPDELR